MTDLSIFLGLYLFGTLTYWTSYILLRPHMNRSHKHLVIFLFHMFLGQFLICYLPIYLYLTKQMDNPIVLFVAIAMGLSGLFHHLGFLKDIQRWRGFITPKKEKVGLWHGPVSHLLFATSYIPYGLLVFYYFFPKTVFLIEKIILCTLVIVVVLTGFVVLFDGIRMYRSRKKSSKVRR